MKKNIILLLLLLIYIPLTAQINKNGIPFIKNYSPNEYNASEQNWAICEDNRGIIYVGNNDDGVLEFDGNTWNKIPISNSSIVRSITYAEDGTIYVGGVGEFGYLAPDIKGKMHYHSLTNQLDAVSFKDVWKIYSYNGEVYFCAALEIFKFKNKKLEKAFVNKSGAFLSFQVFDKVYWGNINEGLQELTEDSVKPTIGGDFFKEIDIFSMLPWSENEILISTIGQGIYIYNVETGLSKAFSTLGKNYSKLNTVLLESQIYNGIKLSDGNYALATLNNGCLVFNPNGELIFKLDKENGLQDLTVINLFESLNGNLWLSLNKGISFAELKTPFTRLGAEYGIEGISLDVVRYNNVFFTATTSGVYLLEYNNNNFPVFNKLPNINNTVWDMEIFSVPETKKQKLIFATGLGIWEYINKREALEISKTAYKAEVIFQSKIDPCKLYIGHNAGFAQLYFKNGKWIENSKVIDISDEVESIIEDSDGNLWLGTAYKGVIRLQPDMSVVRYGIEEGIPELGSNKVFYINGEVLCSTLQGLYCLNKKNNLFEKYKGFGEEYFQSNHQVKNIYFDTENELWIVLTDPVSNIEYIEKLTIDQDHIVSVDNIPFKRLIKNSFHKIAFDGDNGVWIATSDAIYNYHENLNDDFSEYYNSLIRQIEIGIDSIVFYGTYYTDTSNFIVNLDQPEELKKVVPYRDRSFQFYFSTPYFPTDEVEYSYKLEGYDDIWSSWGSKAERGYTNLNNGSYKFMVKAKNIYGIESKIATYEFAIKPPWYKTILAYLFYVVLSILVIIVIVKIYTRRLELEKIRLEQIVKERTEEVVRQKDEIAEKNESITASIEYAKRIQTAILPSNEYANEILPEHFILFRPRDIVSGDFYWMNKKDDLLILIAADCTGHGVPGAFMSMLGVSFLNEIVNRHDVTSAAVILNSLRKDIKKTLGQEGKEGEAKDGMDIALCIVDLKKMKMQYAGAYNPLYLFRNNELMEFKADRMPIGIYVKEKESFTDNDIDLQKGDVFYIFSDGYQDQFGGEDGMKFKTKNYKQFLLEIHQKPMAEQREILDTRIDEWRGRWEQVDDIIILGIRV